MWAAPVGTANLWNIYFSLTTYKYKYWFKDKYRCKYRQIFRGSIWAAPVWTANLWKPYTLITDTNTDLNTNTNTNKNKIKIQTNIHYFDHLQIQILIQRQIRMQIQIKDKYRWKNTDKYPEAACEQHLCGQQICETYILLWPPTDRNTDSKTNTDANTD